MAIVGPNIVNTVDVALRLPLMEAKTDASRFAQKLGSHQIYVPSNDGGRLIVGLLSPAEDDLLSVMGPDGTFYTRGPNGEVHIDIEPGQRRNGLFGAAVISPSRDYRIYARFEELGVATRTAGLHLIPWNFWFFPYADSEKERSAWGGTIFQPLHKYEKAFGVSGALEWEKSQHSERPKKRDPWEGHCNVSALASIAFEPPPDDGVEHGGVLFSCEEIKLLAAEIFGRYGILEDVWTPFHPPSGRAHLRPKKPSEDPHEFAVELSSFLRMLRREMRHGGRALAMDLRDANGSSPEEVWNHAVFMYRTTYWQADVDDPTLAEGRTVLFANADFARPTGKSSGMPAEVETRDGESVLAMSPDHVRRNCRFRMRFKPDGSFDVGAAETQWLSVHAEMPRSLVNPDLMGGDFVGPSTFVPQYAVAVTRLSKEEQLGDFGNPLVEREHVLRLIRLRPEFG